MVTHTVTEESALASVAREVLASLSQEETAQIITLRGELGAGKTAFTKALARELGITEHITSPTFVIMKTHAIPSHTFLRTLIHIDAYRVDDEDEMRVLNFEEILKDPSNLVCLEWPERIPRLIPVNALHITILEKDGTRTFTYDKDS